MVYLQDKIIVSEKKIAAASRLQEKSVIVVFQCQWLPLNHIYDALILILSYSNVLKSM